MLLMKCRGKEVIQEGKEAQKESIAKHITTVDDNS